MAPFKLTDLPIEIVTWLGSIAADVVMVAVGRDDVRSVTSGLFVSLFKPAQANVPRQATTRNTRDVYKGATLFERRSGTRLASRVVSSP